MRVWMLRYVFVSTLFICSYVHAVGSLPGSVEPGRVQQNYLPKTLTPPRATAPHGAQPATPTPEKLGEKAKKVKFKLKEVILKGNKVISTKELSSLYQNKINKLISVQDLLVIVQSITNYYRNKGYILSQAILPPQTVNQGIVKIQIVEGYFNKIKILGNPRGAKRQIMKYGQKILEDRPIQLKTLEHYMYLTNTIPGASIKAVTEPSKTIPGAADLNLVVEEKLVNLYLSYDNYGTLYLGPHQITGVISLNSIFLSGDVTRLTYLTATHDGKELRYGDISYSIPLASNGLQLTLDGNKSLTMPGFKLKPLNTRGSAATYTVTLQYPIIAKPDQNLTLSAAMIYLNSVSTQLQKLLYDDRIRPLQLGAAYTFADSYKGSNIMSVQLMHGFDIWDAANDPHSLLTSHFGADAIYTKWNAQATRVQGLFDRFSANITAQGQYSYNPLLVEEQYGFGGSVIGRGYDPAEILGDDGVGGSFELRMDTNPATMLVNTAQYYMFYDAGKVWDKQKHAGVPQNMSATSAGFGVRFSMKKFITGNVMITQVLTKPVAAEALIGRGKCPRLFFSVVASD